MNHLWMLLKRLAIRKSRYSIIARICIYTLRRLRKELSISGLRKTSLIRVCLSIHLETKSRVSRCMTLRFSTNRTGVRSEGVIAVQTSEITPGLDAVFMPGKIHGCEDELYIVYFNEQADEGNGCMEIEIVDYETILKLYNDVEGNYIDFFDLMPDYFQCEWKYETYGTADFDELCDAYQDADFIYGRDGDAEMEMYFIVNWAKQREKAIMEVQK